MTGIVLLSLFLSAIIARADVQIVPRNEWEAQPATEDIDNLSHPIPNVIIMHTATDQCSDKPSCSLKCRFIQELHMESKKWADIAYNFLIGGDGLVYEGRGWDKVGAHTKGYNSGSIGIGFIGLFSKDLPKEASLQALKSLLEDGVKVGKLAEDYKLYGQRQFVEGHESPGEALYNEIKKWDHWSERV